MKKYSIGAVIGIALGILVNSHEVGTSTEWRFNNPVPISSTLEEQFEIVSKRPWMVDTSHSLDFFGFKIPLKTIRSVTNPVTMEEYQGKLDGEGNIHISDGIYRLRSAHDSQWYEKE